MANSPIPTHLKLEYVDPASLEPDPENPRKHIKKQIAQLKNSISRFGFLIPIQIDGIKIIAGHGRVEAAKQLGLTEIPAVDIQSLSEADRTAFGIAENRLSDLSEFDPVLLQRKLLHLYDLEYDIEVTGFTAAHLDFDLNFAVQDDDAVPKADPLAPAVSRVGDVWQVGAHRLICGNARDAASYETLLGNERAAMIFGDAPYNVPIAGHVSGLGKKVHREFAEASGEMSPSEFTAFLRTIFRNCARFSGDGSIHFICMDWRHIREMLDAADGIYTQFKQLIVFDKQSPGMGSFYRSQHELIFVFKSGSGKHINNFGLGKRHRSNIWTFPGATTFRKGRAADLEDHPTVKPTAMVADAILDCSNRGDLILDPFCGSGTTLLAAHRTNRRGAAIEIDPIYVDTAIRRLTTATGLIAKLIDGRTFAEVAAERATEVDHG